MFLVVGVILVLIEKWQGQQSADETQQTSLIVEDSKVEDLSASDDDSQSIRYSLAPNRGPANI